MALFNPGSSPATLNIRLLDSGGKVADRTSLVVHALPVVVITLAVLAGKIVTCALGIFVGGYGRRTSLRVGMGLAGSVINPGPDEELQPGDRVLLLGKRSQLDAAKAVLSKSKG